MNITFINHDRRIDTYRPMLPSSYWEAIGDFVRTSARDVGASTEELMRRRLIYITRFVMWCWQSCGMPLDRSNIFTASLVDEFTAVQAKTQSAPNVARQRTLLLAVVEELNTGTAPSSVTGVDEDERLAPYSAPELAMLRSWAAGQSNMRRRHNAAVLLSLGIGAGLRPSEIRIARRGNVLSSIGGLTVVLEKRSIPVLREWEDSLREVSDVAQEDEFLFQTEASNRNSALIPDFVKATSGFEVKPLPQRLRATWLVTQLRARTPLQSLLDAAGLSSLASLTPYLRFVNIDPETACNELRNAGDTR